MSTSKLLARASAVALFASFLTACGGGGGGGDGGPTTGPGTADSLAVMDRANAKQFGAAYGKLLDLGGEALNSAPYLISQMASLSNAGTIDETFECSGSGSVKISGTLNSGNVGTITLAYDNCSEIDYYYGYTLRYSGSIRITTRAFSGVYPTAFDYHYENYRFELPDLHIDDTYSGDFSVDPDADGTKLSASVKLTNGTTQKSVESTDYVAIYAGGSLPVRTSGRVRQSQLGAVAITGDGGHIYLSGKQGVLRIEAPGPYIYNSLHIAFDSNNDNAYESFAWVPWGMLGTESADNNAPLVNVSNPGLQPQPNQDTLVPINGVYDAEFDLLSYSIQSVQTPGNADPQLTLHEDQSFSFHAGSNGDYVFALTVDDGRGGVTTQNITFHVSLPAPLVQAPTGSQLVNGTLTNASVQPSNLEAGPFTYQILSGPAGMTVDAQGTLQWQASSTFFDRVQMQVTVKVSNADHDVTVPVQFSVEDGNRPAPLVRSGNWGPTRDKSTFVLDFNNDGTSRVLMTDNANTIYTLKYQGGNYVQDWVYPYAVTEGATIDRILPIDIDNDGRYEIAVQIGGKIQIINEAHTAVARSVDLGMGLGYGLAAADIDNDGHVELIVLAATDSWSFTQRAIILDAATLAEKWRTPNLALGTDFAVGNVDNDAALELVFGGGYVYDGATQGNEWAYNTTFGDIVVAGDVDGDGVDEIVATRFSQYQGYPTAYSAVSKSALWSIATDDYTCGLALAQLDNDNAKEIITSSCLFGSVVRAFDANGAGATQLWARSQTRNTNGFAVGDIDGDSDLDLVQINSDPYGSTRSYPSILDVGSQTLLFDGAGVAEGDFTGAIPSVQSGARQVLFSTRSRTGIQEGFLFQTLDPVTQALVPGSVIAGTPSMSPAFCAADYDGDGNDDVIFSAVENYSSPFVESYDLLTQTQQWKKTSLNYSSSAPLVACGDFNNDGHVDIATQFPGDNMLSIDDATNQSLLWSTNDSAVQIAAGDGDGDGKLELYAISNTTLKKYVKSGNTYINGGEFILPTDSWFFATTPLLSLTDIDGDGRPEIVVAVANYGWVSGSTSTTLLVLNSDLSERSRSSYTGFITAIAPEYIGNGKLVAIIAEDSGMYSLVPARNRAALVDVVNGNWIWRSPVLLGTASPNSLHYDASAPDGGSISIGTSAAMYITR